MATPEREAEIARVGPGIGPIDALLSKIGEAVGARLDVGLVYGAPVERQGVTVIPVAKARWGFGGGAGSGEDPDGGGAGGGGGGGGGAMLSPVGYIEIAGGRTRFRPIFNPSAILPTAVGAAGLAFLLAAVLGRRQRR